MAVGKIQRTARGLLQFLGMVGTGHPPTLLADEIRATFDLTEWYGSQLLETRTITNVATAAPGDSAVLTVPSGEAWRLMGLHGALSGMLVGEGAALSLQVSSFTGGVRLLTVPYQTAVAAAAVRVTAGLALPVPMVLAPGDTLFAAVEDIVSAAARTLRTSALVQVFRV